MKVMVDLDVSSTSSSVGSRVTELLGVRPEYGFLEV